MESRNAGYDRSETVLRWTAAALAAVSFAVALACGEEPAAEMRKVTYAEAGARTVMAVPASSQGQGPVSEEITKTATSQTRTPGPAETTGPTPGVPAPGLVDQTPGDRDDQSTEATEAGRQTEDETPVPETEPTPKAPWEHYDEGIAAWKSGETTEAEAHLREWVAHSPEHVKGRVNLARVLIEIGRPHEAKEHATLAANLDPASAAARRVLARSLAESGDSSAALLMYEEALWIDPDDHWSLNNMGYLLILGGRSGEAVAPLALAARLDSTNAMFRANLGVALESAGYPAAALQAFVAVVAIDPGHTRAVGSVARLHELLGEDVEPEVDIDLLADDYRRGLVGIPEEQEPRPVEFPWKGH